jgi:hypothetical protein
MTTAHEYAKANRQQFETQLGDLLRIKSISTLPECKGRVGGSRHETHWLDQG